MVNKKEVIRELVKLKNIIYGDSPDTHNLNAYKGLVKNQFRILLKNLGLLCGN